MNPLGPFEPPAVDMLGQNVFRNAMQPPPVANPRFSGPDELMDWLADSSAKQDRFRDVLLGNCVHCHKSREGMAKCPHCHQYQS